MLQGIVGPALGVVEVAKLLEAVAGVEANKCKTAAAVNIVSNICQY